jgi:hypothetical protein
VGEHAGWLAEAATDIEVMIDGRDRGMLGQGMGGCTCIVEHAGGVMPGVFRRYCIHRYIPFQEAAQ